MERLTADEVLRVIIAHPAEFSLGYEEGLGAFGMTYDDDPFSDRSVAYDHGRSLRQGMEVASYDLG